MSIKLTKSGRNRFTINLAGSDFNITKKDLKSLLAQAVEVLAEGMTGPVGAAPSALLGKLQSAEDITVQGLLRTADHEDILVLLKTVENEDGAREKLYKNMTENARKMFLEDLQQKYKEAPPAAKVSAAMGRLSTVMTAVSSGG